VADLICDRAGSTVVSDCGTNTTRDLEGHCEAVVVVFLEDDSTEGERAATDGSVIPGEEAASNGAVV
jgi:hypothetical protein